MQTTLLSFLGKKEIYPNIIYLNYEKNIYNVEFLNNIPSNSNHLGNCKTDPLSSPYRDISDPQIRCLDPAHCGQRSYSNRKCSDDERFSSHLRGIRTDPDIGPILCNRILPQTSCPCKPLHPLHRLIGMLKEKQERKFLPFLDIYQHQFRNID